MGWNELLPYPATEGPVLLGDIMNGLTAAALTHEIAPAAVFYVKRLKA